MMLPTPLDPVALADERAATRTATLEHGRLQRASARVDVAAASCRAPRHAINEDAHSALDGASPVYVVADGVGGGAMAARASHETVAHVHRALDGATIDEPALAAALLVADREVARTLASHTSALGAATVVVAASGDEQLAQWALAWVGDCRAYRLDPRSGGDVELLTQDDTYRHLGELPPTGGSPDDPARMVGNGAVSAPNVISVAVDDGAMLVLCSDGVHKHVSPADLGSALRDTSMALVRRCARVVALARAHGSRDDATVLVVQRHAT